ncbi:MAG TPA: SPOR domain-containing protein [Solirubrobacterales bacterium]
MGVAIVLAGAGAALAILLSSSGESVATTVMVNSAGSTVTETITTESDTAESSTQVTEAPAAPPVEAGRYVQAGSFRTNLYAESERERLEAEGVDVEVVSSDGAQEFYPGFQVLLAGPVEGQSEEKALIKALGRNGVSAYARSLSPARETAASEAAGDWGGTLERSSSEHPNLDDSLIVTLEMNSEGTSGTLEVPAEGCSQTVDLAEKSPNTLTYSQDQPCVSEGDLRIRPTGDELMVSILPLDSDTLVTGSLTPR